MTRWATLAIALLFSAIAAVQYTDTAFGQAGGGWITLFDGKNLDQWQGDGTATFKIEDGSVVADDKKDPKAVASYLVTKQSYKDFEIRAEFWVSDDANSGIFFRCTDPSKISGKTGYEANIFDTAPRSDLRHRRDRLRRRGRPMPKAGGKWNTYRDHGQGPTAHRSMLNGKKTVDVAERLDSTKARSRCNSARAR